MSATKADELPRPWPLLAEGQDPDSLEARVAFHLHRLRLVGRALYGVGYHKTDAADLAAARHHLSEAEVSELAGRLNIAPEGLLRGLTTDENREWAFYRASAANPRHVWEAARSVWTGKNLNDQQAAEIMGFRPTTISDIKTKPFVLNFVAAQKLTTALKIPGGPESLLPLPKRDVKGRNR